MEDEEKAAEQRALVVEANPEITSSSCCWRCTKICLCLFVVLSALVAVICVLEEPKPMSDTDKEFDELSQVVLQLVKDHKLREEAKQVEGDAEWGKDLKADAEKIMDLMRAMENQLSPEVAAKIGIEITSDDVARMLGVMGTHGHQFNLEDSKSGAFQGDMVPSSYDQLQSFTANAEEAQRRHIKKARGSFGGGKPWAKGVVKYCFHTSASDGVREAVDLAIGQYKKAVPCIRFEDVGFSSGEHCLDSPAVLITSEHSGCWSYVGMLAHRSSQKLNLQAPGCDSVGTVLHELGHALGMSHEQSRPDRDEYVNIHHDRIRSGKGHNFDISAKGDTERPYDLLSIMHYDADSFSTSDKPTISAKDKAYELYTDDPSEYHLFKMGNRVGLTQLDADQLSDLYRAEDGLCVSHLLSTQDESACTDLLVKGKTWKDRYDQTCEDYVKMEERGHIETCSKYSSGTYCCDCGGGLRLQKWSWDCDLCRPQSVSGCQCKFGSWSLFGKSSHTTCANPGYVNHFPVCVVEDSCKDSFTMDGKKLAQCHSFTGYTTKGCRCKRQEGGWKFHNGQKDVYVPTSCGNPNGHKDGPWCYVEEEEKECQGDDWGTCEWAKA